MAKHLLIDTFTRELRVYSVSATRVAGRGVILRFVADLGPLVDLGRETVRNQGFEIILPLVGCLPFSSKGFVEVHERVHPAMAERTQVIGIQGFPWMKGTGAFQSVKAPWSWPILIFRTGAYIDRQREGYPQNWYAVMEAREWHETLADHVNGFAFVLEGQIDSFSAFKIGFYLWQAHRLLLGEPYLSDMPAAKTGKKFL